MNDITPAPAGLRHRVLDRVSVTGTVTAVEPVAARMRRIRIAGPALRGLAHVPGQQVRVHTGDLLSVRAWARPQDLLRTYSVRSLDADAGELDLCVMDHEGDGPGARWARGLTVGQQVRLGRPEGSFTLRPQAPYHVFAGEETASVAFAAMLGALPAGARAYPVVETATPGDRLPMPDGLHVTWVARGAASAAASQLLVDAVRALELPDEPGVAYVAGEARTVQMVRAHLVRERGWPRRSVLTKPFWAPGKKGMD